MRKVYRSGSHRSRLPSDTLRRVEPFLAAAGITRLADVTGLDRLGLPVFMAYRPTALSLSVSQGKGTDAAAARASAAMEALELFHAETMDPPRTLAAYEDLPRDSRPANPDTLLYYPAATFDRRARLEWIEGATLEGERLFLPLDLARMDFRRVRPRGQPWPTSNGLASGNTRQEALVAALCELIERDALGLWQSMRPAERGARRADAAGTPAAGVAGAVAAVRSGGCDIAVWDITSDIGVAAFVCRLIDRTRDGDGLLRPCWGSGCHPDRDTALLRAILEAAQTRLTIIVGARDDIRDEDYTGAAEATLTALTEDVRYGSRAVRSPGLTPHRVHATFAEDIADLADRLRAAGFRQIGFVELTRPDWQIPVVRAFVPGLGTQYRVRPQAERAA